MLVRPSRFVFLILSFFLAVSGIQSWEIDHSVGSNFAYYVDDNRGGAPGSSWFQLPSYVPKHPEDSQPWLTGPYSGWGNDDPEIRSLGTGWGSVELEVYYRFRAKTSFLAGSSTLTKDNNITFIIKPFISPATMHLETEVQWTPVAFLKLLAGVAGGTGWPLGFLGVDGLALNMSDDITNTPRGGWAGLYFFGGTFQFDMAAVIPGEWNHIVISATGKARYLHYSKAGSGESWYWRADGGRNFNGWEYKGDYALGWRPPWKVNFIGLVAEHRFTLSPEIRNMSTIASGGWGSDFHFWRFGPAVNIDLNNGHGLTVLLQFRNGHYISEETAYARWFQKWVATGETYIKLDRLALAYTWNL
ncbi:MAG: hypothetical protein KAH21_06330 [Spirochaetaceae bacterium]|nr:hypothetical protein [Spirochaetaceae bacterium]